MPTGDRADYASGQPLSSEVVRTLQVFLAGDDPVCSALRAQIPFARVVGGCECGCPSVGLEVDHPLVGPAPSLASPVVLGSYDDGTHNLVLFTDDGYLSSLELGYVSDEVPTVWPDPAILVRTSLHR
ncbi:hypothetical protein SAMN05216298_4674 [Glycomyces sambucus]|uniref:Uncharacterized protein n=1 Tax=Glycomyces sambucus TaxID=380244 RepID=A0A1G9LX28_9ACTN|nr:hypothetical protein [Glycomyces sambucus]SDL65965.1 hypothetical protein SAMN05216298_4674 [Glycomyces sambucus]